MDEDGGVKIETVPMADPFGSAPDCCQRKFVPELDDVVTFTVDSCICHAGDQVWVFFQGIFIESISLFPPCSFRSDVA